MQRRNVAIMLALTALTSAASYWLFRSSETPADGRATRRSSGPPSATGPHSTTEPRWVTFEGACDASGAVPIDERHFAVADDEDNVIRVYDARLGGKAVRRTNLSKQLALGRKGESDIEAATSWHEHAYWLSSHARNARGEQDPNRSLLITTDLPTLDARLEVQGQVYRQLLEDLEQSPALQRYDLRHAAELAPEQPGALNLEGLTATPEGALLIGFRSPVPAGKALLVPLLNPDAALGAGPLRFGAPLELDLGGLGVRSLSFWRGSYLIAAGPAGPHGPHRLYRWQGRGAAPELIAETALEDINPEAFFSAEGNAEILLLSDDGKRLIRGKECKKLDHKGHKRFRGLWLRLPSNAAAQ